MEVPGILLTDATLEFFRELRGVTRYLHIVVLGMEVDPNEIGSLSGVRISQLHVRGNRWEGGSDLSTLRRLWAASQKVAIHWGQPVSWALLRERMGDYAEFDDGGFYLVQSFTLSQYEVDNLFEEFAASILST